MRAQVILAALLVLFTGTVRFCPACMSAEQQNLPANAHACCEKPASVPNSTSPSDQQPSDQTPSKPDSDCPRAAAGTILQAAALDLQPEPSPVQFAALFAGPVEFSLIALGESAPEPVPIDTSPPITPYIPIRI